MNGGVFRRHVTHPPHVTTIYTRMDSRLFMLVNIGIFVLDFTALAGMLAPGAIMRLVWMPETGSVSRLCPATKT
jgi:hypothetical protein